MTRLGDADCIGIACREAMKRGEAPQPASEWFHSCPFDGEIHDDSSLKCRCCEECTEACNRET